MGGRWKRDWMWGTREEKVSVEKEKGLHEREKRRDWREGRRKEERLVCMRSSSCHLRRCFGALGAAALPESDDVADALGWWIMWFSRIWASLLRSCKGTVLHFTTSLSNIHWSGSSLHLINSIDRVTFQCKGCLTWLHTVLRLNLIRHSYLSNVSS